MKTLTSMELRYRAMRMTAEGFIREALESLDINNMSLAERHLADAINIVQRMGKVLRGEN